MGRVSPCYSRQPDDIAKYQFLRDTQERSEVRFYSMLQQHRQEVMPIVYTPTVGKAVQQYSDLYTAPRGITVSPRNINHIDQIREDYPGTMPAWGGCRAGVGDCTDRRVCNPGRSRRRWPGYHQ